VDPIRKKRQGVGGVGIGTGVRAKGNIMSTFVKLWKDESGASAAEYALILAIIGTGIAVAAIFLGGTIGNAVNDAGECIKTQTAAAC
jgi:pilus assembly protein Flp/PilA